VNLHFVFRILPITYSNCASPAYASLTSAISVSISASPSTVLGAFLVVLQKFRLFPVVNLHPGVVLHSTIFFPLQPDLFVALTCGLNGGGGEDERKEREGDEEEEGDE